MSPEIDNYINAHYSVWLDYARCHCRQSRVDVDPAEVVNNVLCELLTNGRYDVGGLIARKGTDGLSEFDYLIFSIVRRNIISPRSTSRYVKGGHLTDRIGDREYYIADIVDSDNEEYEWRMQQVREALATLNISARSRRIFLWRFEGNSFKDWSGGESLDHLYEVYNRIELLIRYHIWRKNKD